MSEQTTGPRTYGNWRKPRTAGLFGLGTWGTRAMFLGLIVVIIVVMTAGLIPGGITFLVFGIALLMVSRKDADGRSALTRVSTGWAGPAPEAPARTSTAADPPGAPRGAPRNSPALQPDRGSTSSRTRTAARSR